MAAAEPADLAFDAAFLMRALLAGDAEERVEGVMRAQRDKPLRLGPVPAPQHPDHGGLEVVVADPAGHRAEILERQHMPFQERLLRLGRERNMKRPPRARQPQHEQPQLQQRPGDHGVELTEVNFSLRAGQVRLRHADLGPVQAQLGAAAGHMPRHRHLRHGRAVLGDQPLPDPPGSMPLLARHILVGHQPPVDHLHIGIDRRAGPRRVGLPRRRHRRLQRLPHRPPVHTMAVGQFPDRDTLDPAVLPDLLEKLHS